MPLAVLRATEGSEDEINGCRQPSTEAGGDGGSAGDTSKQ